MLKHYDVHTRQILHLNYTEHDLELLTDLAVHDEHEARVIEVIDHKYENKKSGRNELTCESNGSMARNRGSRAVTPSIMPSPRNMYESMALRKKESKM